MVHKKDKSEEWSWDLDKLLSLLVFNWGYEWTFSCYFEMGMAKNG